MQSGEQLHPRTITLDELKIEVKTRLAHDILAGRQREKAILSWPDAKIRKCPPLATLQEVYVGQHCNDLRHGVGLLIWATEPIRFYEGMFQNGSKHGPGLQCFGSNYYLGHFVNGQPEDEAGVFLWVNGDTYHGAFVNGMRQGYGRWVSQKETYEGYWQGNKPNGKAMIKCEESEYNGEVRNGVRHGQGRELFRNGDRYQGMYCNGKPQGKGTYAWRDGAVYTGLFKNGIRHGTGVWKRDEQVYEGQYLNDKRHGFGTYKWEDGSQYVGTFANDLREGEGAMTWPDSSVYKGVWVQGMQHGEGAIFRNGHLVEKGLYQQGQCVIKRYPVQNRTRQSLVQRQDRQSLVQRQDRQSSIDKNEGRILMSKPSRYSKQSSISSHRSSLPPDNKDLKYKFTSRIEEMPEQHLPQVLKHVLPRKRRVPYIKNKSRTQIQPLKPPNVPPKLPTALLQPSDTVQKKLFVARQIRKSIKITPESLLTQAIATQLTPIKWKNFNQLGSY